MKHREYNLPSYLNLFINLLNGVCYVNHVTLNAFCPNTYGNFVIVKQHNCGFFIQANWYSYNNISNSK